MESELEEDSEAKEEDDSVEEEELSWEEEAGGCVGTWVGTGVGACVGAWVGATVGAGVSTTWEVDSEDTALEELVLVTLDAVEVETSLSPTCLATFFTVGRS